MATALTLNQLVGFTNGDSFVVNKGADGSKKTIIAVFNKLPYRTEIFNYYPKVGSVTVGGNNIFTETVKIYYEVGWYSNGSFSASSVFNTKDDTVSESDGTTSSSVTCNNMYGGSVYFNADTYPAFRITVSSTNSTIGCKVVMSDFSLQLDMEYVTATATFKDWNGTILKTETVYYGYTPSPPTNPSRAADAQYTYSFSGWSPAVGAITANTTYTAQFTATLRSYNVTFKDENGTTLKTESVDYGSKPTPPAAPEKADTAQWDYTFDGWYDGNGNKWTSSTTITGDTTFTARYTATVQKYTVRWFNYDGTLLETDTDVPYGTKPTYNGSTPTKAGNAEHSYQFIGWNYDTENGITPTLGTTYIDITAQFREIDNTYKVTWVNDGVVIEEDEAVPYGNKPDYNGATPTKASDVQYDYTFIGWSANVNDPAKPESELETVKGNITYTAVYSATLKLYPITIILFDSEITAIYEYGTDITIVVPAVDGYKFVRWTDGNTDNPRTVKVTGEATYQAVYEKILPPEITSVQMLYNNKQISAENKVPAREYFRIVVGAVAYDS